MHIYFNVKTFSKSRNLITICRNWKPTKIQRSQMKYNFRICLILVDNWNLTLFIKHQEDINCGCCLSRSNICSTPSCSSVAKLCYGVSIREWTIQKHKMYKNYWIGMQYSTWCSMVVKLKVLLMISNFIVHKNASALQVHLEFCRIRNC